MPRAKGQVCKAPVRAHRASKWTVNELRFLFDQLKAGKETYKQIASHLGRGPQSARQTAKKLSWTKATIHQIPTTEWPEETPLYRAFHVDALNGLEKNRRRPRAARRPKAAAPPTEPPTPPAAQTPTPPPPTAFVARSIPEAVAFALGGSKVKAHAFTPINPTS